MDQHNTKTAWVQRDFLLVVIGQIISLFGNAVLRYALPLHLLNVTGSPALFGLVSACSFIPLVLLSPIGGMVADRVNKRNIMVCLDFMTAILMTGFMLLSGKVNMIALFLVTLILLYGIQGAYQPSVQASIPALVPSTHLMPANAVINLVSSMAALLGPILGGILYTSLGISTVLIVSIICFFCSAVMEIFIKIPFQKREKTDQKSIWQIAKEDFLESMHYIRKENPAIGQVIGVVALFNLVISTLLIVGMPVIVTRILTFQSTDANLMLGFMQAISAAGGLLGGILAGVLGRKINIGKGHLLLGAAGAALLPLGIAFVLRLSDILIYGIMSVCCLLIMALGSFFSIQAMAYIQGVVPGHMTGKIISVAVAVATCAQPAGQAIYGIVFEMFSSQVWFILLVAALLSVLIAVLSAKVFRRIVI